MSEANVVGRAGFNVRHLQRGAAGTRVDRASLLHESMRELDDNAAAHYAAVNINIVAADTKLNVAMVNDGHGGFRPAKSTEEVLEYGDARIGYGVQKADPEKGLEGLLETKGRVFRKWNANSFETSLIVVSLPRTLCDEIKDAYPVIEKNGDRKGQPVIGPDGEPLMRSRWVARDRDEAIKYFQHAAGFLASDVLSGGHDAIHGYDINFDEAYPHMQLMADTCAPDPKHDGFLRVEASQVWGAHRDVLVDGKDKKTGAPKRIMEQPKAKMARYQAAFREHLHGLGYEVELEASERSKMSLNREEYAESQDALRVAQALDEKHEVEKEQFVEMHNNLEARAATQKQNAVNIKDAFATIDAEMQALPSLRKKARDEGHAEGVRAADIAAAAKIAEASAEAARLRQAAQIATQRLREEAAVKLEQLRALADQQEQVPPDIEKWLDTKMVNGKPMREIFDADMAKNRQSRARAIRAYEDRVEPESPRNTGPELG